jgi:ribose 5-phosphate isomerase B
MNIAIGADHRGFEHKEYIKKQLSLAGQPISWIDVGAYSKERSDYPLFAQLVVQEMEQGNADYGILICGSGVGMAITANRIPGIYAGIAWNKEVAAVSKEHDNINILVLPSDFVSKEQAVEMVVAWLNAHFKEGRYQERLDMIDNK